MGKWSWNGLWEISPEEEIGTNFQQDPKLDWMTSLLFSSKKEQIDAFCEVRMVLGDKTHCLVILEMVLMSAVWQLMAFHTENLKVPCTETTPSIIYTGLLQHSRVLTKNLSCIHVETLGPETGTKAYGLSLPSFSSAVEFEG